MKKGLKGRSFLTLLDFTQEEIKEILRTAHTLKKERKLHKKKLRFQAKTLAMLFEKPSTRTRCSFETAFGEEGGYPVFLTSQDLHLGSKETIEDTARVLGRMFDCIMFRGYKQETAQILMKYSGLPVYNGLTDSFHPTQTMADLMTIEEEFGTLKGIKCAYVGDGRNNVARSLLVGCCKTGVHITIVTPEQLMPESSFIDSCKELAAQNGASVLVTDSIEEGVKNAHVLYTDVWISMGEEEKKIERIVLLTPYQVNNDVMNMTGLAGTIFLHCLPAVKGQEVTEGVFEGPASRVWEQAENRKHTIKAILLLTLGC
ncbi:MAG: ornithine carbamoyltransferase [Spirochaetales bacterium]|nr:ornithine carbamoyltransferase [Spirochaetales bacterium]